MTDQLTLFRLGRPRGHNRGVENLYRVWVSCSPWEIASGHDYYPRQRDRLGAIAAREGVPLATVVGMFAALSPNNTEDGTYRGVVAMLHSGYGAKVTTYLPNRLKAEWIRCGKPPLDVLGGRKVRSFYRNTMDPEDPTVVTVDGHMYSCWKGRRVVLTDAAHKLDDRLYTRVESDVQLLASLTGQIPCRLQSTLWARWRRIHRILSPDQLSLFPFEMLPENLIP
jgi:hypothetical protein